MRTLIDFSIFQEYNEKVLPRGDRLLALEKLMDWNAFKKSTLLLAQDIYEIPGMTIQSLALFLSWWRDSLSGRELSFQISQLFGLPVDLVLELLEKSDIALSGEVLLGYPFDGRYQLDHCLVSS